MRRKRRRKESGFKGLSGRTATAPRSLLCSFASQSLGQVQQWKKGEDGSKKERDCLAVAKDEESLGETSCAVVCGATSAEMTETARLRRVSAVVDWTEQVIVDLKWMGLSRTDHHPTLLNSFYRRTALD